MCAEQLKTDLLSLPASRELDALVAEKVMGCLTLDRGSLHPFCRCSPAMHNGEDGFLNSYSTSIAAAWEVLEHLKPALNFVLFYFGEQHPVRTTTNLEARRPAFCCEIHPGLHVGRADTAPLAICRAALQAVGATDAN